MIGGATICGGINSSDFAGVTPSLGYFHEAGGRNFGNLTCPSSPHWIQLNVPAKELAVRRKKWKQPKARYTSGLVVKYMRLVSTASLGAVTDLEA